MGSGFLGQMLKSLCYNTPWNYAVFWKVNHRSHMFLSWEDGYCDYPKPIDSLHLPGSICFDETDKTSFHGSNFDCCEGTTLSYSIRHAVANMSCLLYSMGQGMVGKVASTGRHSWIFAHEYDTASNCDYPFEWQAQFEAGIKTILLVPLFSQGVVQLGSLDTVAEDVSLVDHIKDMFLTFEDISVDSSSITINDFLDPSSSHLSLIFGSLLSSEPSETMTEPNILSTSPIIGNSGISSSKLPTVGACLQSVFVDQREDSYLSEYNMKNQLIGENIPTLDPGGYMELEGRQEACLDEYSFPFFGSIMDQPAVNLTLEVIHDKMMETSLRFPMETEVHNALEPSFGDGSDACLFDAGVLGEDKSGSLNVMLHKNVKENLKESSEGYLLDAIVGNISSFSGEKSCSNSPGRRSSQNSSVDLATSYQTHSIFEGGYVMPEIFCSKRIKLPPTSPSGSSSRMASTLVNEDKQTDSPDHAQSKKSLKPYQASRRKGRTTDVDRPRPRDRQMIQDRVKELREIVPNGAKCSIDALLERTIKHMIFLRNITSQAEKLRSCAYAKASNNRNWEHLSRGTKDASWACEMGGKPDCCPIIVENLDHPGHVLIEMLCEERGLFLDVVEVIRQLKLTILKGIMESRCNKTWAHFIVEVSKGFQCVDILWPLMRLLQRSHNSILSKF